MAQGERRGDNLPQIRSYSDRKPPVGVGRMLAWFVLLGSLGVLFAALAGPVIIPAIARLVPSRFIVAYAPEEVQELAFSVDPQLELPTTAPDEGQAEAFLESVAPTATPIPPVEGQGEPAFLQPTSAAVATVTVTPAYVPSAAGRAVQDGEAADLTVASTLLTGFTHTYQGWNNCGPATITTALSYYDDGFTQNQAASYLKPNLEDRNVRPDELVSYINSAGYVGTYRVNGDLQMLKTLLRAGFPVVVEKGFDPEPDRLGWMGHYLLVTGYSDEERAFVTMDSYLGPDRSIDYDDLDRFWRQFNRPYIVVHRADQLTAVASIVGDDMDDLSMYTNALYNAQAEINLSGNDPYAWFNLGSNLVALGRYQQAAEAFDFARQYGLPWRMLWYQFGPYEAYYRVGRYEDVITLADVTIANNPYAEESFYYKGLVYMDQDLLTPARREFERALRNNAHYTAAQQALDQVNARLG